MKARKDPTWQQVFSKVKEEVEENKQKTLEFYIRNKYLSQGAKR